ncbi:MAG TPA: cysteine--tRNA ligase [Candidatus Nanoarchaeia archaeon]|nr:cysteine--tRNA ligase [Candidatus Nanoarchaeia archaeon]
MLKLYNTLTRKKEIFKPLKKEKVGLYTCGPTVYDYAHIGNLRTYIFEDFLKRTLLFNGFKVKHVMNITDVGHLTSDGDTGEDKLEKGAKREGRSAWEIAEFYTEAFKKDISKLNILEPEIWCRATQHIKEQIGLIRRLEKKGFTYQIDDGVYFDSSKLKDYGKLAGLNISGLKAGARVDVRGKKNKTDFALWKFSPENETRQMEWDSQWGRGFPGWHIECSAMAMKYLGEQFDIHCGGIDHIPVHHTNEIAQSEAATGKKFVKYWMHGEFLTLKDEKISKSKGNFITLESLEKQGIPALAYRYLCLGTSYRKQLMFNDDVIKSAEAGFNNIRERVRGLLDDKTDKGDAGKYEKNFLIAINDDLNMPKAIAVVWDLLKDEKISGKVKYNAVLEFDEVLGLGLGGIKEQKIPQDIKEIADARLIAREHKDWKEADKLRELLKKKGWAVEDSEESYRVKRV